MYPPASEDGGFRSEGSSDSKSSLDAPGQSQISTATNIGHNNKTQSQQYNNERNNESHHNVFTQSFGPALAALRKKRKKFSASRSSTSMMMSGNTSTIESISTLPIGNTSTSTSITTTISKNYLYRASSVPARDADSVTSQIIHSRRHDVTQSQRPSLDKMEIGSVSEGFGKFYKYKFNDE